MIIYAIFMCIRVSASCQLAQQPWVDVFGDPHPTPVYRTLQACQQAIHDTYGFPIDPPPKGGRFVLTPGVWYECRHRHVDTWSAN